MSRRDVIVNAKPGKPTLVKFHGSVFGDCSHRHVLDLLHPEVLPAEADDYVVRFVFEPGNDAEEHVKRQLVAAGWTVRGISNNFKDQINVNLWGKTSAVARHYWGDRAKHYIGAHLDGNIIKGHANDRLEVKLMSPKKFDAFVAGEALEDKGPYPWQVSAESWGLEYGERGEFRERPYPIRIVALNKGDKEDWHNDDGEFVGYKYQRADKFARDERLHTLRLTEPPHYPEECLARCLSHLEDYDNAVLTGNIPECDSIWNCHWKEWQKDQAAIVFDADNINAVALLALLAEYRAAQDYQATAQGVVDEVKGEVKADVVGAKEELKAVKAQLKAAQVAQTLALEAFANAFESHQERGGRIVCGTTRITLAANNRINVKELGPTSEAIRSPSA